jgi:GNAT superfamily N-acetyltransferase
MNIRPLELRDVPQVESIFDLYWSGEFRKHLSERLQGYAAQDPLIVDQGFKYLVADENGEVVGVAALRRAPEHMRQYAVTSNPVEFYIIAVKDRGRGVGTVLRNARIEEAKRLGYTEALLFSGEDRKDAWPFHDNSEFTRVASATAPNGEPGHIWQMIF